MVLFLSPWYPNRYDPMPGLFVQRHAEIISGDFTVSVIHAFGVQRLPEKFEILQNQRGSISEIRIYYRKSSFKFPFLSQLINLRRFWRAHLNGFNALQNKTGIPDMVHVNILTRVGVFALYLKFKYRIPYVITEHWSRYLPERNDYHGILRKVVTRLVVQQSQAVSTVSGRLKKAMEDCGLGHRHFYLVNNVVDFNHFKPVTGTFISPVKIFAHITCFDDYAKNETGLIRAVYELSRRRSDFLCLMVGDGADRRQCEELAQRLGINSTCVKFTGLLEGKALADAYNQSLFTVLFSNFENMPVVIPESFACGKPVIATNVGGISEFVNEKNGILISPGDETGLSEAIGFMLDHSYDYDASYIRQFAMERFSPEAVKKQLLLLYSGGLE